MNDDLGLCQEELESWIVATKEQLRSIDDRVGPLLEEQHVTKERLRLLEQLRSTFAHPSQDDAPRPSEPNNSTANHLEEAAAQVLKEAGRPLHVSQIRRELVKRGVTIPGQGLDANVIARLARCEDFVRVARGTYALAGDDDQ